MIGSDLLVMVGVLLGAAGFGLGFSWWLAGLAHARLLDALWIDDPIVVDDVGDPAGAA